MYIEDENVNSAANFMDLRRECMLLVNTFPPSCPLSDVKYHNILVLAREHMEYLKKTDTENVAREFFHQNNKIVFIKFLRDKYSDMGLIEAKMMADGYWARFNYNIKP